jgi:16S rRNA (guanine966-N2)-methyltransferase
VAEAGRIIGGRARGIRLAAPGPGTRPLGDRAKQTLFAIVQPWIVGARVLDLFAGSGGAGLEALSRGAQLVVFVERSRAACRVIARNRSTARLESEHTRIVCLDVLDYLARDAGAATDGPFDLVIVDPPYADAVTRMATLERLGDPASSRWLSDGAFVVATHDRHHELPATVGLLASERRKRFGETMLTFFRRRASEGGG